MSRLPKRLLARLTPAGTRALAVAAAAVVVLAVAGATLATHGPGPAAGVQSASVPASGQSRAVLRVTSGTPLLLVRVASSAGPLAQAQTPAGAPVRPVLKETGGPTDPEVDLSLASGGGSGNGSYPVTVTLRPDVTWALVFAGGTQRTVADLRGGRVALVAFTAGSSVIDVTLPRPRGTVPLILAGGASQLRVRVPAGVPAQVTAGGGAGEVTLDGTTRTGVAGGSVLASPGWTSAGSRVEIDATSGVSQLSVSRWGG